MLTEPSRSIFIIVIVIVGGMGVDDKAKVKRIDTSVKEEADEDENAPPEGGKKDEAKPKAK